MTNELITEARELCEKATPAPWEWDINRDDSCSIEADRMRNVIYLEDIYPGCPECGEHLVMNIEKADAKFIARSRTLIPELANALEKANAEIERLLGTSTKCPGLIYIISHGGVTTQEDTHD